MQYGLFTGYFGIMVCETEGEHPFTEKNYFRRLCLLGEKAGLCVFVFSPLRIDWENQKVVGYTCAKGWGGWKKQYFPLPQVIYDRCFFNRKHTSLDYRLPINKLRKQPNTSFLGYSLKGKWDVQKALSTNSELREYLPNTELYLSIQTLTRWLKHNCEAFLKPQGGCQGRGVLHLAHVDKNRFEAKGRDQKNRMIRAAFEHPFALSRWMKQFIGQKKYLIQEYLTLTTTAGEPYDIRSLMQKNGKGIWRLTGTAIRKGSPESVTSNLHGGGCAEEVIPFLTKQFGEQKAVEIQNLIKQLSMLIPSVLEQYHGRLAELGIDFGVDRQGRVWILEVNSKPGRSVFTYLNNAYAKKCAVNSPIEYARYLLDRQLGG